MDASSGQLQEMANNSLESMLVSSKAQEDQRKPLRPQPEQALKCPRCDSTNTKFCYYNNYSLSQPRYFCKSCRRYWTNGGTLRNVPVGGGCRKNKRSSSSSSSSSKRSHDQPLIGSDTNPLTHFPHLSYDTNDHLSLAFARLQKQNGGQLGFDGHQHDFSILGNPTSTHCDILRNPSISMSNATTPSFTHNNFQNLYYGFGNGSNMGEADHHHHHHHHHHDHHDHGVSAEMLMPFGDHHHQMSTTVKQESCNSRESESNMVLWGFPRQLNNIADGGVNDLNSTWHGLLNSPLM